LVETETLFTSQLIAVNSFLIGLEPAAWFPWQQMRLDTSKQ